MSTGRGKDQSGKRRNPVEDGPRLFKRGRWFAADLRPWGGARPTLRDPGDKTGKGERTEFKDVAREWAEAYVARLRRDTHDRQRGIKKSKTLKKASEEFLDHRRGAMSYNTWANNVTAIGHMIAEWGEGRPVHTITTEDVQKWVDDRAATYAPASLVLHAINMRTFLAWTGNPTGKVVTPVMSKEDPDALTDDEIEAVTKACETDTERKLIGAGLATGCRKAELWALEWEDFRADGRSVRVVRQMGWPGTGTKHLKGKQNRTTLVLPGFLDEIERGKGRLLPGPVSDNVAGRIFHGVLERAGVDRIGRGSHVLRHTFGRLGMEKYEWSIEMLRVFMGHQSILTTQRYAHFGEVVAIKLAEERTYHPKDLRKNENG